VPLLRATSTTPGNPDGAQPPCALKMTAQEEEKPLKRLHACAAVLLATCLGACVTPKVEPGYVNYQDSSELLPFLETGLDRSEFKSYDAVPRILVAQRPEYSVYARSLDIEGVVDVNVKLDDHGKVEQVEILHSPHATLSNAIIVSMKKWRFTPPTRKGQPVSAEFRYKYEFKLVRNPACPSGLSNGKTRPCE
jgi:TonB family protein